MVTSLVVWEERKAVKSIATGSVKVESVSSLCVPSNSPRWLSSVYWLVFVYCICQSDVVSSACLKFVFFSIAGPPQRVLSNFLHSFVESSRGGIPFRPAPVPVLGLSQSDKQCIRDRSSIMARHFFADRGEEFINSQVCCLSDSFM